MLAWFKFQAKIPSHSGVYVQGEWQKHTPPSPSLSKNEGLKNIGNSISIRNLIFAFNSVTDSDLICYDSLLQNATDVITKCDSYYITKRDRSLLQNVSGFLLQNVAVLLQNATVIKKCDSYYKMRRLLQIETVQLHLIHAHDWKIFQNSKYHKQIFSACDMQLDSQKVFYITFQYLFFLPNC